MVSEKSINYSVAVQSKPAAVKTVCEKILSELKASNFNQNAVFSVHLALEEAFLNAVQHGNNMDPEKEITIDYTINSEKAEISVTDKGSGFDPDSVPDPRCGENLYKYNGRGLFLMRSYMDDIEFNHRGNCVRMVKYKQKKP